MNEKRKSGYECLFNIYRAHVEAVQRKKIYSVNELKLQSKVSTRKCGTFTGELSQQD